MAEELSLNCRTSDSGRIPRSEESESCEVISDAAGMNSLNADIYHLLEGYLLREEFQAFLHVNKARTRGVHWVPLSLAEQEALTHVYRQRGVPSKDPCVDD